MRAVARGTRGSLDADQRRPSAAPSRCRARRVTAAITWRQSHDRTRIARLLGRALLVLLAARAFASAARRRRSWSKARTTCGSKNPHAGRDRQEDRGHRVLLVRLPALRRARADPRQLAQAKLPPTSQFRRVPVMFQQRWVTLGKVYYTLEALGEERSCRPRCSRRSTARTSRCGTTRRSSTGRRRKGLDRKKVEDMYNSFAIVGKMNRAQAAGAGVQHPVGADDRRRRQVHHRVRPRRHARATAARRSTRWSPRRAPSGRRADRSASGGRRAARADRSVFITGASSASAPRWRGTTRAAARRVGLFARRAAELDALAAALAPRDASSPTPATCAMPRRSRAPAADFIARFGAPDVVIANAGISRGTLTEHAGGPAGVPRGVRHQRASAWSTRSAVRRGDARGARTARWSASRASPAFAACRARAPTRRRRPRRSRYLESLRVELRGTGVAVVTICPGYIATPMTRAIPTGCRSCCSADAPRARSRARSRRDAASTCCRGRWRWRAACCACCRGRSYDAAVRHAPRKPRRPD